VLIATGLHRPNLGEEMEELLLMGAVTEDEQKEARWVGETVNVVNHYAREDLDHVDLGSTIGGTPVKIDKRFIDAELKVVVGLVEPHFMAGFSGGRKLIVPGVSHMETISTVHSSRFMSHPRCKELLLEGNPLHQEQLEVVNMIKSLPIKDGVGSDGSVYAVNAVLDDTRFLCHVTFGDIVASHQAAVDFVKEYAEVELPQQYETVVTSSAGYPLDKTYYQTVKGMVTCLDILAPGGDLIIVSEISEGFGSAEFRSAQENLVRLGPDAFQKLLESKSHASIDEWQTEMLLKSLRKGKIHLYSTGMVQAADRNATCVHMVDDLAATIKASLERQSGPEPCIAIIPEGPYVVPVVRRQNAM